MESINTDKTVQEHAPWETKVIDFRTGKVVDAAKDIYQKYLNSMDTKLNQQIS